MESGSHTKERERKGEKGEKERGEKRESERRRKAMRPAHSPEQRLAGALLMRPTPVESGRNCTDRRGGHREREAKKEE